VARTQARTRPAQQAGLFAFFHGMMTSMRRSLLLLGATAAVASGFGTDGPRDQWRTEAELGELPKEVVGKLPNQPPRYQMNQSTIIMPCNNSGYMDPKRTVGWSIIDFDWSNGKAIVSAPKPHVDCLIVDRL
jgi:hypothetical protein